MPRILESSSFRGLSASELTAVNNLLGRTKFPAGAMILTADQPGEIAYVVVDEHVKGLDHPEQWTRADPGTARAGEIVGELALTDRAAWSADVTALEPAVLVWLDRGTFERLRRDIPGITENLLRLLASPAAGQRAAPGDGHARRARTRRATAAIPGRCPRRGVAEGSAHPVAHHPVRSRRVSRGHARSRQRGPWLHSPPPHRSRSPAPHHHPKSCRARSLRRLNTGSNRSAVGRRRPDEDDGCRGDVTPDLVVRFRVRSIVLRGTSNKHRPKTATSTTTPTDRSGRTI